MDKNIRKHYDFMKDEIEKIEKDIQVIDKHKNKANLLDRVNDLHNYHKERVANFQHERLIHLIVTLSFVFMMLLFISALFIVTMFGADAILSTVNNLLLAISLIFLITVLFYVKHYYSLENGIQRLYAFSEKIKDIRKEIGN